MIQEDYNRLDILIHKFKDGEVRYRDNALFHSVIKALFYGQDTYSIIDSLLTSIDEQQKILNNLAEQTTPYIIIYSKLEQMLKDMKDEQV